MKPIHLVVVLVVTALAWPVLATTAMHLGFDDLCRGADAIVVGKVETSKAFEEDGRVLTRTVLTIEQALKGDPAKTIEIVQLGGKLPTKVVRIAGMPGFTAGERAVVFLEKTQGSHYVVYGLDQGKMPLNGTSVMPLHTELTLLGKDGKEVHPAPSSTMSLHTFKQKLQRALGSR